MNIKSTWFILCNVSLDNRERKNLKAFFIAVIRPSLNENTYSDSLIVFRNDVTLTYVLITYDVLITYGKNHSNMIVITTSIDKFINL